MDFGQVSDSQRDQAHSQLSKAYARGLIDFDHYQQVSQQIWQLDNAKQLQQILDDIPSEAEIIESIPENNSATQHQWPVLRDSHNADVSSAETPLSSSFQAAPTAVGRRSTIAILGETVRSGRWVVPSRHISFALMGENTLDLRDAQFQGLDIDVNCWAFMGEITIIVPPEMEVEVNGFGFLGSFAWSKSSNATPAENMIAGCPKLRINGLALMASVEVKRRKRKPKLHN